MAVPFKSTVFTGGSFAASGSNGHPTAGLLIYSASRSTAGLMQTADLAGIGSDVFVFVSGSVGGKNVRGVATFGGDVVVSGTLYNASGGTFASVGGADKQVQFNDGGTFAGNSGLLFDKSTATLTVGNLVITGSLTTITTSNLVVSDPLIYIASGSNTSNTNGGIAIASGSSYANQSLVFGRVDTDTWGAGRQDVSGGTATSLTSMTLAGIRSSRFEIGGFSAALSSSTGQDVVLYSGGGSFINLVPGSQGLRLGAVTAPVAVSGSDVRFGNISVAFASEIPPQPGVDSYFFVSGSMGSRGTTTRGTAVFGGDLVASGTVYGSRSLFVSGASGITGSLVIKDDIANTQQLRLSSSAGSFDFDYFSDGNLYLTNNRVSGGVYLTLTQPDGFGNAALRFIPQNGGRHIVLVDPSLIGGSAADPTLSTDTNFFVNGVTGSFGTTTRGTAVFGGDLLVSGTINSRLNVTASNMLLTGDLAVNGGDITSTAVSPTLYGSSGNSTVNIGYFANTITLSDNTTSTGFSFNVAQNRSGNVTLNLGNGGGTGQTKVANIVTGGGAGSLTTVNIGSTSGNGTTNINTPRVLVPGELQVTGSLMATRVTGSLTRLLDGTSYIQAGSNVSVVTGSKGQITISATSAASPGGLDTYVQFNNGGGFDGTSDFVFDSVNGRATVRNFQVTEDATVTGLFTVDGGITSTVSSLSVLDGVSTLTFGSAASTISIGSSTGRTSVSGSVEAPQGLSGSLTRLTDGRSYLNAGANVTITSASNGQVTISSTGGSGSPAGSNTYVQFNDSGSFGASSTFSFEKATNTLSVQNITLGGNLDSQAVDARWYLKNNSADSLSFWDGSGGSRRFQINMGDSQERFIAYDGSGFAAGNDKDLEIVHDGTDSYVKNATGKLYLSGSTSGVFVTGSAGLIVADGNQPTLTLRATTDTTNQAVFYQETGGDTYISNQKNSGKFFSSVKTSAGVAVRYLRAIPNAVNYNTIVSFVQGLHDFFDPQTGTTDVNFFVGGKVGSKGTSGQRGTALFAGDMVVSGSTHFQGGGSITGSFQIQGSITPSADSTYTLGTEQLRWGHVYTGDLHLRNERGDWTILEEEDFLCVINNKTGKKYRMMLQPLD
jgi:hypothetical protein